MESANSNRTLYINNLLPFMNREYLYKILNKFKEIKELKLETNPLGLPGNTYLFAFKEQNKTYNFDFIEN